MTLLGYKHFFFYYFSIPRYLPNGCHSFNSPVINRGWSLAISHGNFIPQEMTQTIESARPMALNRIDQI